MVEKVFICFDSGDFQRVCSIFNSEKPQGVSSLYSCLTSFQEAEAADLFDLLNETDMTVVFIGKHTFENEKCLRAINESFRRGNAFLAVYLNNAEDVRKTGKELLGKNPFDLFYFEHKDGQTILNQGAVVLPGALKRRFSSKEIKAKADFVKVYDYIKDNGAENLEKWVEEERRRKADFWTECAKISAQEWPEALKVTHKGGIVSFFLYYDWITRSPKDKQNTLQ